MPNTGQAVCPHGAVIHKLEKDMYHGNGKPGVTTRLEVIEGKIESLEKSMTTVTRMFWAVIVLLLTILGERFLPAGH